MSVLGFISLLLYICLLLNCSPSPFPFPKPYMRLSKDKCVECKRKLTFFQIKCSNCNKNVHENVRLTIKVVILYVHLV